MRRLLRDMNPTVRGLAIVALIAAVIVVLSLQSTLAALLLIAQIAFFLAIAFFVFLVWRERRGEIEAWPNRARVVFYGGALLAVTDLAAFFVLRPSGREALAFILVLVLSAVAMWRVWREQRQYSV